jgi:hypothetical protein
MFLRRLTLAALTLLVGVAPAVADPARFDLAGPKVDIRVTRNGVSLPIAFVPNLLPGDQIWLHPDLPTTQSVHYLLIAAFLRGTTNPPPQNWFTRIETWNKKVREEGVTVTVPAEAQQAILFLAPETGGDFNTLRSAVTGRPGIFVRATQDLNEAGFEQARIEKYLDEMKQVPPTDAAALADHSNLLARTLNLKPNPDCFKRPVDQQYNCLTQTGNQSLLDDGHGQTLAATLSNGASSDLINQASYTGMAGAGMYSAYVGAIVDLVRLTSGLHTAQYQYIPAIAFPTEASLNLRLNTAPSFHNPKSVIVIGLPAVQAATLPPLRAADATHVSCLIEPHVAIPIEGAPLVFSTAFAHDIVLHLNAAVPGPDGKPGPQDLPLVPDAFQGGLTIAPAPPARKELPDPAPDGKPAPAPKPVPVLKPGQTLTGTIEGDWGFDHFSGPTVPLQGLPGSGWLIVTTPDTPTNLIVGQPNHLQLVSSGTACIKGITIEPGALKVDWKLGAVDKNAPPLQLAKPEKADKAADALKADRPVDLTVNLQHAATPGTIQLAIQQYGQSKPDQLGTKTFSEPARIESLAVHENDQTINLSGTSLSQVKQVAIADRVYTPDPDGSEKNLTLSLPKDTKPLAMKSGEHFTAHITLADGRVLDTPSTILISRPHVTLLSKRVSEPSAASGATSGSIPTAATPIKLGNSDDLPLGDQFLFFLKSDQKFPRSEQIEISGADDSLHTTLSIAAGSLVLQDSHTVLAKLDPLKTFGTSAYGPLRLRAVAADGTQGDWIPLATLVRLPNLTDLHCPADVNRPCILGGTDLYLLDSIATDPGFATPTTIPEGFVDTTLSIPHPSGGNFFLKLRDDPTAVHVANLPILTDPTTATNRRTPRSPAATTPSDPAQSQPATPATIPAATTPPPPPPATIPPATRQ